MFLGDSWATLGALHIFLLVRVPAIFVALLPILCSRGVFLPILGGVCKSHRSREIGAAPHWSIACAMHSKGSRLYDKNLRQQAVTMLQLFSLMLPSNDASKSADHLSYSTSPSTPSPPSSHSSLPPSAPPNSAQKQYTASQACSNITPKP